MSIFDRFPQLKDIPSERFPRHILIIPDGNGRWAKRRNLPVTKGHQKGYWIADAISRELSDIEEISIVTYWGFSSDNWKRSDREVKKLMLFFRQAIETILSMENRRFIHLGRKDRLAKDLAMFVSKAEKITEKNTGQIICLAIDFGGEDQMLRMLEKARKLAPDSDLTREMMLRLRDGGGVISPADLLIRTSGEKRTSDIGWLNGAPTELYFIDKLFPDIETSDIVEAIVDFSRRDRRFGSRK